MTPWIALATSIALSSGAQIVFKSSLNAQSAAGAAANEPAIYDTLLRPGIVFGLFLYGLSVIAWFAALRALPLSVAYPLVGVGLAVTATAGVLLFDESVTVSKVAGIGLIVAGATLLARTSG